MAIAGGDGGTISTLVFRHAGLVRASAISQIRPKRMVEHDLEEAVRRFQAGEDSFAVQAAIVGQMIARLEELGYPSGLKLRSEWLSNR